MNPDGSNQTRLTTNTAVDLQPQWSPDGTKIVFRSERDGGGLSAIYVMNADGSGQTRLTFNGFDAAPAWSPDGTKIVYRSIRMDGNPDIYVMDADGSNQMRMTTDAANDAQPRWSPNGSQIVFMSQRDGNPEIYVMDSNGSNQTRLTDSAGEDANPDWRLDGLKIIFNSVRDGNYELYTMNPNGTGQFRLTNSATDDGLATWSPDGSKIIFSTNRDGNYEIYSMDADGSNPLRLTNEPTDDGSPDWQPATFPTCGAMQIDYGQSAGGHLGSESCVVNGRPTDLYTFNGITGQNIAISLDSVMAGGIQPFLQLIGTDGTTVIASHSGSINARIPPSGYFQLPASGSYTIRASTSPGNFGVYSLSLALQPAGPGSCSYAVSPAATFVSPTPNISTFGFDVLSGVGCPTVPVALGTNSEHITILSNSAGRVTFGVTANGDTNDRTGTIIVNNGESVHTITQFGTLPPSNDFFAQARDFVAGVCSDNG